MRYHRIIIGIMAVFVTALFAQETELLVESLFHKVARELKTNVSALKIEKDDLEFYGYGRFRTKLFDQFMNNPMKIDPFLRTISKTILNNADSIWALSYFPWARIDEGVRRGLIQRYDKTIIDSLTKPSEIKYELCVLLNQFFNAKTPDTASLTETQCLGILVILSEIKNSLIWIEKALSGISENEIQAVINTFVESGRDEISNPDLEKMIEKTDFKALAAGAMELGFVLQLGMDIMKGNTLEKTIIMDTKYGRIVLGSNGTDTYEPLPYLLIVDFGGDDIYYGGGVSSKKNPVSIIIDYSGNDKYQGKTGCGTGIAGYGFVIDFEGNDTYCSNSSGTGTGIFGQGIILDHAGDDLYMVEAYGIGAGLFGTGVVSDLSGNDHYTGFQGCQGFGFVKGCGILIDREGNDTYVARDDTVKYPSSQTAEHNISLAQGMGFGIRADYVDGHSMAGGVGILIDGAGDDRYSCGVFGQACGYWFGTGILVDYSGNDEYNGVWYVQGAGAHFALGILIDSTGNDRFTATKNMAQGAGHDFTLGFLLDYEGNDYHNVPNLSLGSGNANGMGLFIDISGEDEYLTHGGITLGNANTDSRGGLRDYMKTIGIFIDAEGKDKYIEPIGANNNVWRQKSPLKPPLKTEWSMGIDF